MLTKNTPMKNMFTWKTLDGEVINMSDMGTDHLINAMRYLIKKSSNAYNVTRIGLFSGGGGSYDCLMSEFYRRIKRRTKKNWKTYSNLFLNMDTIGIPINVNPYDDAYLELHSGKTYYLGKMNDWDLWCLIMKKDTTTKISFCANSNNSQRRITSYYNYSNSYIKKASIRARYIANIRIEEDNIVID